MTNRSPRLILLASLLALGACSDAVAPKQTDPDPKPDPAPKLVAVQWASVSAGEAHTCGVSTQGVAYCWGAGGNGQLGTGSKDSTALPTHVAGGVAFAQVAAGVTGTCARTAASEVYCWGDDNAAAVLRATGSDNVVSIKAPETYGYDCGLKADGGLSCWQGASTGGQAGPYRAYAPGPNCLLDAAGHVLCMQHRLAGDTHPFLPARVSPTAGDPDAAFTAIVGGSESACALRADGAAFCTTSRLSGSLGAAWVENLSPVPGGHVYRQIAAAGLQACGLDAEGRVWCWQLQSVPSSHIGAEYHIGDPAQVAGLPALTQVSVGSAHACGVTAAGDAYCWGSNRFGRLGSGTFAASAAPVKVSDARA